MLIAKLNACFAAFGRAAASRKYTLLFLSLIAALSLSWPTAQRLRHSLYTASITADASNDHFWQYSPHVQPNINLNTMDDMTTAYQIRFAHANQQHRRQQVTQQLLTRARAWYRAFTTHKVDIDGQSLALSDMPFFIFYSPFSYWHMDEDIPDNWEASLDQSLKLNGSLTTSRLDPLSVFDNVTLDKHGRFVSADAIVLTVILLRDDPDRTHQRVLESALDSSRSMLTYLHQPDAPVQTWQYKLKLLDYNVPLNYYLFSFAHVVIFFLVSKTFGNSQLKSQYGLGLAAIFTSISCVAASLGILDLMGAEYNAVPWYLFPLVANVASLENLFLLTNAVINAGCDMQVKEKVGRGLQSVGIPMLGTLGAELVILGIGRAMDVTIIKQFCLFAQVALVVEYCLDMTFFIAVLSIDINRAELSDLDDRQVSKRLRELAKSGIDPDQREPDFCPIGDSGEGLSCGDCKDFKTHRAVNALMQTFLFDSHIRFSAAFYISPTPQQLCLVILSISFFHTAIEKYMLSDTTSVLPISRQSLHQPNTVLKAERLRALSTQYWETVNPGRHTRWIRVEPPYLATLAEDDMPFATPWAEFEDRYILKSLQMQAVQNTRRPPSRLRSFIISSVQRVVFLLWHINLPICALLTVLVGILLWLNPACRDRWLLPLFKKLAVKLVPQNFMSSNIVRRIQEYLKEDDVVHMGAISAQEQYQHNKSRVGNITIKTLSGQHVADIRRFDVNAKHGIAVSCGQDDRMIAWDMEKARSIMRLDVAHESVSAKNIKIGQGNKWIVSPLSNGVIRIWSVCTSKIVRELFVERDEPATVVSSTIRNRRQNATTAAKQPLAAIDRVLDVQFLGAVTEYCHPAVEEVAVKTQSKMVKSQNYLVSVHKSGMLREWDIASGTCLQTIPSGHSRDVTILHAVECKRLHRKHGVSWIFTASKDGRVTCWERELVRDISTNDGDVSQWTCAYSFVGHDGHAITALATEHPVGGMGILVTGASDGSVKVWNFETGKAVCELKSRAEDERPYSIVQLAVTRYCEAELSDQNMCRGCDTCFGNGFLIAACTSNEKADTWRLERVGGGGTNGSCTLCSKDYHRNQYRRRDSDTRRQTVRRQRQVRGPRKPVVHRVDRQVDDDITSLLDIEQLAGEGEIELSASFLGSIDQPAGRGLAFCGSNKLLAGVRRKSDGQQWEVWFASLQYQDSETAEEDENNRKSSIPVEAFDLDTVDEFHRQQQQQQQAEICDSVFGMFGLSSQQKTRQTNGAAAKDEDDEASELLPFSMVRHVLPLDGLGLSCDFGNFIKLIYLDNEQVLQQKQRKHEASCRCPDCVKSRLNHHHHHQQQQQQQQPCTVQPSACSILPNCPKASECRAIASKKHIF
ncbi:sterol-sensing domain of SREBP cleavage-activation-domain-containing protein [Dichotomocladium elegans]|nr:sterol-sensing domain of SREBP cleavage-activation-domain-containing protein [Dichotomocladium elegans]